MNKFDLLREYDIFGTEFRPQELSEIFSEISKYKNKVEYYNEQIYIEEIKKSPNTETIKWINYRNLIELIQNTFICNITGFLRLYNWLKGIDDAMNSENYIVFCTNLRGFIESSADFLELLSYLPKFLAENYKIFEKVADWSFEELIILDNIQVHINHFLIASKENSKNRVDTITGKTDKSFNPKSAMDYLNMHLIKDLNLYELYKTLCEVNHPASDSLMSYIVKTNLLDNTKYYFQINLDDKSKIINLINENKTNLNSFYERIYNLCLISFKTLNEYDINDLKLQVFEKIDLSYIKAWRDNILLMQ